MNGLLGSLGNQIVQEQLAALSGNQSSAYAQYSQEAGLRRALMEIHGRPEASAAQGADSAVLLLLNSAP